MTFMTELSVDEYGYLHGGEEAFPVNVIDHDWLTPYPSFDEVADFTWDRGSRGEQPHVFRHPEIRDWVCDETAWSVLSRVAPGDVRRIGGGRLHGRELHVVQIVTTLDAAVDLDSSIVKDYGSYRVLEFPAFHRSAAQGIRRRAFRLTGSYTDLFLGDRITSAFEEAGVRGLQYTPVPFTG